MTAVVPGAEVFAHVPVSGTVAGTATPSPTDGTELDAYDVTPGLLGFVVIFAVVLAVIPIFLNMTGKLRRLRHRAELEEAEARRRAETDEPEPDRPGED
ncbi:hypothetical protein OEB99_18900 [Actinotalea sp. M2MS4P-6]|uniref:hypothetical protein n=1 Tax=Actinotalea sp. M2MS4P-6 TaxID=2983762 RepID=UPI0021E3E4BF|nr:hypothetical protein [Actinotalea sp. M2MS4P-6]MCV2396384.1 hypothetical protein [Actinotalea sp. M2MS4P-6]